MAAGMPLKTSFADGNVLPASDLNDITNTLQLTGTYPDQLAPLASDAIRRPLPFATSTGTGTVALSAAAQGTVAVIFSTASRFTSNPIVTTSCITSVVYVSSPQSIATTGFTLAIRHIDNTTATGSFACHYHAIQMTSASSSNS
jgi:hypothetical protein